MNGSKLLLVASALSTVFLVACSEPGTYPITGTAVSPDDPVANLEAPVYIRRGEAR
ncbi:hypothetical protein [Ruegeria faecimaris]|uniref:Lipoprotein-attachment site-containing protein n=1 Tax=Ruegeria faecimaris TaxID=686389 RepID=A0A521AUK3_9RHOB|nr:hypothetical protein [Ruegeria faecimaris]SMO38489.1 hypothetical protein SAMN06265380_101335 [Ruegeria faecimaris]